VIPVASTATLACAALALALVPAAVHAQPASSHAPEAVPAQIGQVSKDSVWVPTPDRLIVRMLQLADTTRRDFVIDLGSGDGRIPIAAARLFGARALGVELERNLVDYSLRSARRQGVAGRATFRREDLFETDLSAATVIALYISPPVMEKLKPRLYALAPGVRVVSHQFTLGDWEPDETVQVEQRHAYLWVVPAKVDGSWALKLGNDTYLLRLQQDYQKLRSSAEFDGRPVTAFSARLRGDEIRIALVDRHGDVRNISGHVSNDAMRGEALAHARPPVPWSARRLRGSAAAEDDEAARRENRKY
jgi:SAM-dependent methyltransferase